MSDHKLYFKNLDSIRFLAAMMVLLSHTIKPAFEYLPADSFWQKLLHTFTQGGIGVSVFFVLSGFLITYLLVSEEEINGKIALKNFYVRRVLRIWPLYFLVVLFTFGIYPLFKSFTGLNSNLLASNVFYHLSFLSNFDVMNVNRFHVGHDAMSQNITWSVSIEEQFYLFWPLLFVLLPKKSWFYAIFLVIAGSLTFRILHHKDNIVLYFHTFSVLLDLGIGGLMALLIKNSQKIRSFFENTSTLFHLTMFILSFCLIHWEAPLFSFPYGYAISRFFICTSFAFIIAAQALTKSDSILNLGRFSFANKWGKYTYGIYLIHPISLTIISIMFRITHIELPSLVNIILTTVLCIILTLVLSKLSYDHFESRFLKLKDRFTARYSKD